MTKKTNKQRLIDEPAQLFVIYATPISVKVKMTICRRT